MNKVCPRIANELMKKVQEQKFKMHVADWETERNKQKLPHPQPLHDNESVHSIA